MPQKCCDLKSSMGIYSPEGIIVDFPPASQTIVHFSKSSIGVLFIHNKIHPFKVYISMSLGTCIQLCSHNHNQNIEYFITPESLLGPLCGRSPSEVLAPGNF